MAMSTVATQADAGNSRAPGGLLLPRAGALTDTLVEPATTSVSGQQLADIRVRMVASLEEVLASLPSSKRLHIGVHDLVRALEHLEPRHEGGFVPSPALCRRSIGIVAVKRCVRGWAAAPQPAVRQVISSGLEDLRHHARNPEGPRPPWWAQWYEGLGRGGRAAVEAEVVTWATQLWTSLEWRRFSRSVLVGTDDDWWNFPGKAKLSLRGRADVKVWSGQRQAFLIVGSRSPSPSWRSALAFPALVAALARGERCAPTRVVGLWPESGIVRVRSIDASALSEAADAAVAAVQKRLLSDLLPGAQSG